MAKKSKTGAAGVLATSTSGATFPKTATVVCFDLQDGLFLVGHESKSWPLKGFFPVLVSALRKLAGLTPDYVLLEEPILDSSVRSCFDSLRSLSWDGRYLELTFNASRSVDIDALKRDTVDVLSHISDPSLPWRGDADGLLVQGRLTKLPPPWQPVRVLRETKRDRAPIDQEAALPAVPGEVEEQTVAALALVVEKLHKLAQTEPENILGDLEQLKEVSQEIRAILAPRVAAVLSRYAGTAYSYAEKQEVAKQVNAMLRDFGLQLRSPTGEPVPLVVGTGGVQSREGVFVVGRGEGSNSARYPKADLMPAPPKKPRGE